MSPRPPGDAAVALRSFPRRFRALFAGLGDDESPDALARRPDADGATALGHLTTAATLLAEGGRSVEQILVADDPPLAPLRPDPAPDVATTDSLDEALAELTAAAAGLADRVDRVSAREWSREGRLGAGSVTAADRLWEVVDTALAMLRAAEATLAEVRREH